MGKRALLPFEGGRTSMSIECLTTFFIVNAHKSEQLRSNVVAIKKNVKEPANGRVDWKGSYNYYLTMADKTGVKKLGTTAEEVLSRWRELMDRGYKVSMTLDSLERFYTATAFANQSSSPNAGYSLSLRHSDAFVAINACWFVVAEVFNWERWEDLGQDELPFNW